MKGYNTSNGYMGYVEGKYILFASEQEYFEFMEDWEGGRSMSKVYFTLTGTKHYFGKEFLKKGTKIRLEKELDNEYDKEAIKVTYEGLGKIGYVANSSYTVIGDSMSAGRIYDRIGKKAKAKVVLVTDHGTICSISKKSLLDNQKKVKKSEVEIEE